MPKVLWEYPISHVTRLQIRTVKYNRDNTELKEIFRKRPDISDYVGFQFYENVKH